MMRRSEFAVMSNEETEAFLQEMSFGVLGTGTEDGWPELTPLNFVYYEGAVYFHSSKIGEKMERIRRDPRVSFSVAREYAIIPSYFSDPKLACPATAYFKSVLIRGLAEPVDRPGEKADVLSAFMRKLQPEGGYAPIDPSDPDYTPWLHATSVVRIRIQQMTAKFKFGQNLKGTRRTAVEEGLTQRDRPLDPQTVALMKAYCPHAAE